jgi:hypothetical protein
MPDIWDRLAKDVYDFGERDAMGAGEDGHGPFEDAPPSFQDFCKRMGKHIVERWMTMGGADVTYPAPGNETRKDVN